MYLFETQGAFHVDGEWKPVLNVSKIWFLHLNEIYIEARAIMGLSKPELLNRAPEVRSTNCTFRGIFI